MALGATAVQVHRDVRWRVVERHETGHREQPIDRARQREQRLQAGRRCQHQLVIGHGPPHHGPQHHDPRHHDPRHHDPRHHDPRHHDPRHHGHRRYGHEASTDGVITSSRTSQPSGWPSAKTTAAATSCGRLSFASGGGLYWSGRPSKNGVCIPPGNSIVTPTSPCVSAASARVNPSTPNFDAQYAVASLNARSPSVDATVTTRPRRRRRSGNAARTTATVPSRFTLTTASHSCAGTSSSRPQESTPAQVTTASMPWYSRDTSRTACSAARPSARSTTLWSPSTGARSSTTGWSPAFAT